MWGLRWDPDLSKPTRKTFTAPHGIPEMTGKWGGMLKLESHHFVTVMK